jgi:hypothetical protein
MAQLLTRPPQQTEDYIGDGVYASYDGYQIRLRTLEGHTIFLDPATFIVFLNYVYGLGDLAFSEVFKDFLTASSPAGH